MTNTTFNENKLVKMTIAVSEDFRKQAKIYAIQNSQNLKDYVVGAIKLRIRKENIDIFNARVKIVGAIKMRSKFIKQLSSVVLLQ